MIWLKGFTGMAAALLLLAAGIAIGVQYQRTTETPQLQCFRWLSGHGRPFSNENLGFYFRLCGSMKASESN